MRVKWLNHSRHKYLWMSLLADVSGSSCPRVGSLLVVDGGQEGRMPAPPVPRAPSGETPLPLWAESVMADPSCAIQQCQCDSYLVWSSYVTFTLFYIRYPWSVRANFHHLLKVTMSVLNMCVTGCPFFSSHASSIPLFGALPSRVLLVFAFFGHGYCSREKPLSSIYGLASESKHLILVTILSLLHLQLEV